MDSLYNTYLKMLTTPFDDPASDLPDISPEDYPALFALADRHCTLPFVLPYFRNTGLYPRFFRNYPLLLLYPMYLNFASSNCLPHLPYIVRFIIFNLLLVPSTNPLL